MTTAQAMGGHARAAALTPQRRSEIASADAKRRWGGANEIPVRPKTANRIARMVVDLEGIYDRCIRQGKTEVAFQAKVAIAELERTEAMMRAL